MTRPAAASRRAVLAAFACATLTGWVLAHAVSAEAASRPAVLVADPVRHALVFVDPATGAQGDLATGAALGTPDDVETIGTTVYVSDRGSATAGGILHLDPLTGATTVVAASAPLNRPQGIVATAAGELLAVQGTKTSAALVKVDPASGVATTMSSGGKLEEPIDVAVGPGGEIYVLDRKVEPWGPGKSAAGGVFRVEPITGAQTRLTDKNVFYKPTAIAVASDGSILVTDQRQADVKGVVRRIDPATGAATELTSAGLLSNPAGVEADGASILVSDPSAFSGAGGVVRVSLAGAQAQVSAGGGLGDAAGIAAGLIPVPAGAVIAQPPPVIGKIVNVQVERGTVRYAEPSKGKRRFKRLKGSAQLPVGSVIDVTRGRILLTSAKPGGGTQTGLFYGGRFIVRQSKSNGLTDLVLTGSGPRCRRSVSTSARKRNQRRLWGDGHGNFRTRGRNSSATVRGTRWLVEERCSGTLTRVKRGVVEVRDSVKHRKVQVRAGKSYLAKRR
jgi:DNA-binding beta-propeller fold protein YncE